MPNKDVHVYTVQRESGDSVVKTLHKNMYLPFSVTPSSLDLGQNRKKWITCYFNY